REVPRRDDPGEADQRLDHAQALDEDYAFEEPLVAARQALFPQTKVVGPPRTRGVREYRPLLRLQLRDPLRRGCSSSTAPLDFDRLPELVIGTHREDPHLPLLLTRECEHLLGRHVLEEWPVLLDQLTKVPGTRGNGER